MIYHLKRNADEVYYEPENYREVFICLIMKIFRLGSNSTFNITL